MTITQRSAWLLLATNTECSSSWYWLLPLHNSTQYVRLHSTNHYTTLDNEIKRGQSNLPVSYETNQWLKFMNMKETVHYTFCNYENKQPFHLWPADQWHQCHLWKCITWLAMILPLWIYFRQTSTVSEMRER